MGKERIQSPREKGVVWAGTNDGLTLANGTNSLALTNVENIQSNDSSGTAINDVLTLTMCVNYGGRSEIADAAAALARDVKARRLDPDKVTPKVFARYLDEPDMPDVDLFLRSSGEQRTSNFLLWQSAYAELAFVDTPWPDFDRRHLWQACLEYAQRDRRSSRSGDELCAVGQQLEGCIEIALRHLGQRASHIFSADARPRGHGPCGARCQERFSNTGTWIPR